MSDPESRGWYARLSRLLYRLEKGNPHATGFWVLTQTLLWLIVVFGLMLWITQDHNPAGGEDPTFGNPFEAMWWAFLHLSDPGYLGDDLGPAQRIIGTVLWALGLVLVTAFFIAVTTSLVSDGLENVRSGAFDVVFTKHTVIVGWNDKAFTLVEELLIGNPSLEIAILGPLDKEAVDSDLDRRVFARFDQERTWWDRTILGHDLRKQVVYRRGEPRIEEDLSRVGAARAGHFVLLADDGRRGIGADVAMLRTYLAVRRYRQQHTDHGEFSFVVEVTDDRFRSHAFVAANLDPRADAWLAQEGERGSEILAALPRPKRETANELLTLVNPDELVSRALVQCSVQPRLSRVFDEILSFHGSEFYLVKDFVSSPKWQAIAKEARALTPAQTPGFLARRVPGLLVVGVYEDHGQSAGRVHFSPEAIHGHLHEWPLVVLGVSQHRKHIDDHHVSSGEIDVPIVDVAPAQPAEEASVPYRVLVLGHNRRIPVLVQQFAGYTEQYPDVDLHLTFVAPDLKAEELTGDGASLEVLGADHITIVARDYAQWDVLCDVLTKVLPQPEDPNAPRNCFDSILLLADEPEADGANTDARVILGVVMLRAYREDPRFEPYLQGTSVVAEILDPRSADVIQSDHEDDDDADWLSDVIVSNQYVSRFMAQVTAAHEIEDIYRELFDYHNREIYSRPLDDYVANGTAGTFVQAIDTAAARNEIAIGFTRPPSHDEPIVLAPDPTTRLTDADSVLVISDN